MVTLTIKHHFQPPNSSHESALQGLCNKWNFMSQFIKIRRQIDHSCHQLDLVIKCSNKDSSCSCSNTKTKHFRRFKQDTYRPNYSQRLRFHKKQRRYFRPKNNKSSKGGKRFLCNEKGHYTKNVQTKRN